MDWIKRILEKHRKEDGTVNMEAAMKEINEEFPKNAVPKETFNDINGQLKTANTTIKTLKETNVDSETLQKTIKDHEATITNLKAETAKKEKESIIRAALKDVGATDADYLIFKSGGIDKYELGSDGKIKDLDNLIKQAKENNPTFFKADEPDKVVDKNIIANKLPGGNPGVGETVTDLKSALNEHYKN